MSNVFDKTKLELVIATLVRKQTPNSRKEFPKELTNLLISFAKAYLIFDTYPKNKVFIFDNGCTVENNVKFEPNPNTLRNNYNTICCSQGISTSIKHDIDINFKINKKTDNHIYINLLAIRLRFDIFL